TTRMRKERLFWALSRLVPLLLPISRAAAAVPGIGRHLKRAVPVANYAGELPLDARQLGEWALLDTFDWLSPAYDQPQTASTLSAWFGRAGFEEIEVLKAGHLVGRGRKPEAR